MSGVNNEQVLIVDDDPMTRRLLCRILSEAGFECREAEDGLVALETLREGQPALVLLDYELPHLNGTEVMRALRADPNPEVAQLATIMLTGHAGEEAEVRCLEAGADDFVTKPINAAVLRARIDTHLRLRSMRRQMKQQNDELEKWRHNLERDLAAARLTQQSLIPQKPPVLPGWDIAAVYRPVIQVGGDIYGWLPTADGRLLFWIADATGHGAAAALLTTLTKLLFYHGSAQESDPGSIMRAVNADFRTTFGAGSFMTAMCVSLDPQTGEASVVGAGHPPLLLLGNGNAPRMIFSDAPPLGLIERAEFSETEVSLKPGEGFLLYTDGLYGADSLEKRRTDASHLATQLKGLPEGAEAVLRTVLARLALEGSGKPQTDDVAAVAVRRLSDNV